MVTGSKLDMEFFKDTSPWTLNDQVIPVVDCNDHLGLLVADCMRNNRTWTKMYLHAENRSSLFSDLPTPTNVYSHPQSKCTYGGPTIFLSPSILYISNPKSLLKLYPDWCSHYFLFSYWISKVYSVEILQFYNCSYKVCPSQGVS